MKTLSITLLLITSIAFSSFSQEKEELEVKPKENYNGFTFNITGLINNIALSAPIDATGNESFLYRRYIKDDVAFRLGFGVSAINVKSLQVDSVLGSQVKVDSTFKRADFFLAPAIEKHIETNNRLDPYLGGQFIVGLIGNTRINSNAEISDTVGVATSNLTTQRDGGSIWGLNVIAGFNYFFADKFAIGAEYIVGFRSTTVGGDFSTVVVDTPVSGSPQTTRTVGTDISTTSGLGITSTAGITLSYFFMNTKKKKKTKKESMTTEG